jgi:hypothetical protein
MMWFFAAANGMLPLIAMLIAPNDTYALAAVAFAYISGVLIGVWASYLRGEMR